MTYDAKSDSGGTVSEFTHRIYILITTTGTSIPALYQVKVTIPWQPEMQTSFQDIRFNTAAGDYIDYWIESHTDSTTAEVWLELPNAITDPGSDTIWMYYGNAGLIDGGDGNAVFPVYTQQIIGDYFSGNVLAGGGGWIYTVNAQVNAASYYALGFHNTATWLNTDAVALQTQNQVAWQYLRAVKKDDVTTLWNPNNYFSYTAGVSYTYQIVWRSLTSVSFYRNNVEFGAAITSGLPTIDIGIINDAGTGSGQQVNWQHVRKYIANEPTTTIGPASHQFTNRAEIKITTTGTSTPALYQVKVTIPWQPEMRSLFQDIRFSTKAGVYIDYWIESSVESDTADVWLELPDAIIDPGTDSIWIDYGNAELNDGGVGADTFLHFIDFESYTANTAINGYSNWTQNGNANVRSDYPWSGVNCLRVDGDSGYDDWAIYTFPSAITENVIFEYHHKTSKSLTATYDWMRHCDLYSGGSMIRSLQYGRELDGQGNDMVYTGPTLPGTSYYTPTVQNQYYKQQIDVMLDTDTMNLFVDDTLKASSIAFVNIVSNITHIVFRAYDANNAGAKLWIDVIKVRKYITNEPTYEWVVESSNIIICGRMKQHRGASVFGGISAGKRR